MKEGVLPRSLLDPPMPRRAIHPPAGAIDTVRSREAVALEVAINALTRIALPVRDESDLERAMRLTAQTALDRIAEITREPGGSKP